MSAERSPATGRRYPLTQVCRVYRVPRSTVYDTAARTASPQGPPSAKRGPKTPASDETLVAAIRAVLAATPFHGEATARCGCACDSMAIGRAAPACCG